MDPVFEMLFFPALDGDVSAVHIEDGVQELFDRAALNVKLAKGSGGPDPSWDEILGLEPVKSETGNFSKRSSGPGKIRLERTSFRSEDGEILVEKYNHRGECIGQYFVNENSD